MRRPIDKKLKKRSKLPSVKKLWSVEEKLGGWDKAQTKFFSANVWQSWQQSIAVCGDVLQHADARVVNQQACSAATHPHAISAAMQHAASCTSMTLLKLLTLECIGCRGFWTAFRGMWERCGSDSGRSRRGGGADLQ